MSGVNRGGGGDPKIILKQRRYISPHFDRITPLTENSFRFVLVVIFGFPYWSAKTKLSVEKLKPKKGQLKLVIGKSERYLGV